MGPQGPQGGLGPPEAKMGPLGPFWPRAEGGRWFLLRPDGFYCDRMVFIATGWFLFRPDGFYLYFSRFGAQGPGPGPRDGRAQGPWAQGWEGPGPMGPGMGGPRDGRAQGPWAHGPRAQGWEGPGPRDGRAQGPGPRDGRAQARAQAQGWE